MVGCTLGRDSPHPSLAFEANEALPGTDAVAMGWQGAEAASNSARVHDLPTLADEPAKAL
jgi:hypothetical protein